MFDFSKKFSLAELHFFFEKNIIFPSSYCSNLIEKSKKYRDFNIYLSTLDNIEKQMGESIDSFYGKILNHDHKKINCIPFNIKDCFLTKDFPTTYGVKGDSYRSEYDSYIVKLMKEHRGILLGKTSIPPYANDVQTYNDIMGITKNPWNKNYSAGGSTGGGAVSVALGLTPVSIGSDFAGSIRIPAHFCGVKGYIPTNGRLFLGGHYPDKLESNSYPFHVGQIGFLSNFLDDFKYIHDILTGKETKKQNDFEIQSFSCAICEQDDYMPVGLEVRQKLHQVYQALQKYNVAITFKRPEDFSFKEVGKLHAELMNQTFAKTITTEPKNLHFLENLIQKRAFFQEELSEFVENKFWLLPVSPTPAIPHNIDHNPIQIDEKWHPYWRAMIHYSRPFNITKNPVVTLPVGKSQLSLPIGIQIVGQIGKDLELIQFAEFVESIIGFNSSKDLP